MSIDISSHWAQWLSFFWTIAFIAGSRCKDLWEFRFIASWRKPVQSLNKAVTVGESASGEQFFPPCNFSNAACIILNSCWSIRERKCGPNRGQHETDWTTGKMDFPSNPTSNIFKTISHMRKTGDDLKHMNTLLRKLQTIFSPSKQPRLSWTCFNTLMTLEWITSAKGDESVSLASTCPSKNSYKIGKSTVEALALKKASTYRLNVVAPAEFVDWAERERRAEDGQM